MQEPYELCPPKASPTFCVPAPAKPHLAVANAPPVDQDVPLYSSVQDTGPVPPNTSPSFCVPAPANCWFPVINAPPADHEAAPLYPQ